MGEFEAIRPYDDAEVAEVLALVMPEQTTAKATRNVTKWMPKALCV